MCERVFGAPLLLREERTLAAAETALLREFVRSWFPFFTRVWTDCEFRVCSGPDKESRQEGRPVDWLMFTTPVECGAIRGAVSLAMSPATARLLLGEAPNASQGDICREQVTRRLGDVPVELRAVLGRAEFTRLIETFSEPDLAATRPGLTASAVRRSHRIPDGGAAHHDSGA